MNSASVRLFLHLHWINQLISINNHPHYQINQPLKQTHHQHPPPNRNSQSLTPRIFGGIFQKQMQEKISQSLMPHKDPEMLETVKLQIHTVPKRNFGWKIQQIGGTTI